MCEHRICAFQALPAAPEKPEISAALQDVLYHEGIRVATGAAVARGDRERGGYRLAYTGADRRSAELRGKHLLVATGRRPVIGPLNLAAAGVTVGTRGV